MKFAHSPTPSSDMPMSNPQIDLEYNVRNTVSPELVDRTLAEYRTRSERSIDDLREFGGICYDQPSRQKLDIWGIDDGLHPIFLVIHEGYWRALSRHDSAFMAGTLAGTLASVEIATVAVDYGLAPHTSPEDIVRQVRAAVAWVYHHGAAHGIDRDRIVVGGSSAGGHLTAAVMVPGWQLEFDRPDKVVRAAMPISGLFILRPLISPFANDLARPGCASSRATELAAVCRAARPMRRRRGSRARRGRVRGAEPTIPRGVGPIFRERTPCRAEPHHYNIFLDLADPASALTMALARMINHLGTHPRAVSDTL